jgi:hypothetical protein
MIGPTRGIRQPAVAIGRLPSGTKWYNAADKHWRCGLATDFGHAMTGSKSIYFLWRHSPGMGPNSAHHRKLCAHGPGSGFTFNAVVFLFVTIHIWSDTKQKSTIKDFIDGCGRFRCLYKVRLREKANSGGNFQRLSDRLRRVHSNEWIRHVIISLLKIAVDWKRPDAGIWFCSFNQKDSNPRSSRAVASLVGGMA